MWSGLNQRLSNVSFLLFGRNFHFCFVKTYVYLIFWRKLVMHILSFSLASSAWSYNLFGLYFPVKTIFNVDPTSFCIHMFLLIKKSAIVKLTGYDEIVVLFGYLMLLIFVISYKIPLQVLSFKIILDVSKIQFIKLSFFYFQPWKILSFFKCFELKFWKSLLVEWF